MPAKRILLVEDEPDLRELFGDALAEEGYAVDHATTVAEAWRRLDAHRYALVIADWRLPDGDGTLIADAAAQLDAKAMVMSGYLGDMPGGRSDGHATLMKPFDPTELIDAVSRAIGAAKVA